MKCECIKIMLFLVSVQLTAQGQDPEFPSEFIMHLKLHNGMVTNFRGNTPDIYLGGLQLVPQYTIIPHLVRAGVIGDVFYTGKKLQAAGGPTLSVKIKTLQAKPFGSAGNIHINFDYLWGTEKQHLLGGGINADIGNKVVIGLTVHRDYNLNYWWLQNSLGIRISKIKKKAEPFN
ncbi:MAG: hypothetical protein JWQ09_1321 [Segetibacter sp.]|nr:hypothetical protein [Segetibacter sp.]